MSYEIAYTGKIKKDIKLAQKRGLNLELFKEVVILLEKNGKLPAKYKAHILKGNFAGYWECHIQPDWLLIWKQDEELNLFPLQELELILIYSDKILFIFPNSSKTQSHLCSTLQPFLSERRVMHL